MIARLRALLRRFREWLDPGAAPSVADSHFDAWDADRRERQLAAFVAARDDLAAHGVGGPLW